MNARFNRHTQLGADTIGGRHQHRVLEPGRLRVKQGAEAPKAPHHARPVRGARQGLDGLNQGVAGLNIHARIAVGEALGIGTGQGDLRFDTVSVVIASRRVKGRL